MTFLTFSTFASGVVMAGLAASLIYSRAREGQRTQNLMASEQDLDAAIASVKSAAQSAARRVADVIASLSQKNDATPQIDLGDEIGDLNTIGDGLNSIAETASSASSGASASGTGAASGSDASGSDASASGTTGAASADTTTGSSDATGSADTGSAYGGSDATGAVVSDEATS